MKKNTYEKAHQERYEDDDEYEEEGGGLGGLLGGLGGLLGGMNENVIMELLKSQVFSAKKNDKRVALIHAVKPFLPEESYATADSAAQIVSMLSFIEDLQKPKKSQKKKKKTVQE